jgi:hypothetical protein
MDEMDRRQELDALHTSRQFCPSQPGRLRHFLNRVPFHPSKQQPYKFSEFSVLSVDKKIGCGRQPTPSLFVSFRG